MSKTNPKDLVVPVESNEVRLLAAAIRCFEKHGVSQTSIDDIARDAGLSRPTAYRVFRSRGELLQRVAQDRSARLETKMKPLMQRYRSFEQALVHGVMASM